MELTVTRRTAGKKSEAKKLRREGNIPAILYSKGKPGEEIVVDGGVFLKALNSIPKGTLSSKVFSFELDGRKVKALIKDIQYHVTSYAILHLDFEELHEDIPVNLNIPIVCLHMVDCAGVKLGGVLRQVIRKIKVTCLPKDIPDQFEFDVRDLLLGQTLKLNALEIPSTVRPAANLNEVAVVIARK